MQRAIRFFTLVLLVLAGGGLIGTVFVPQNAMAQKACPGNIKDCSQCSCIQGFKLPISQDVVDKCLECSASATTGKQESECDQYHVVGGGGRQVNPADCRVLYQCSQCAPSPAQ